MHFETGTVGVRPLPGVFAVFDLLFALLYAMLYFVGDVLRLTGAFAGSFS